MTKSRLYLDKDVVREIVDEAENTQFGSIIDEIDEDS